MKRKTKNAAPANCKPTNNNPMKKRTNKRQPNNSRQTNKSKCPTELSATEFQELANSVLMEVARIPVPQSMIVTGVFDFNLDLFEGGDSADSADDVGDRLRAWLANVPVSEMTKPIARRYECDECGSVIMVFHASKQWFLVSDMARITGIPEEQLRARIHQVHFTTLKLFAKGDVNFDFVSWEVAILYCMYTSLGRLFVAWVVQVLNIDACRCTLFGKAINAALLYAITSTGLTFAEWTVKFLHDFPDARIKTDDTVTAEFYIPLDLAKRYVTVNWSFEGMLAYVLIREVEDSLEDNPYQPFGQLALRFPFLYPDAQDRVRGRAFNLFVEPEKPFDEWIAEAIQNHALLEDRDYFTESPSRDISRDGSEMPAPALGDVILTLRVAILISATTPTARGRYMLDYYIEAGPPVALGLWQGDPGPISPNETKPDAVRTLTSKQ